jgi:hypothetical protein
LRQKRLSLGSPPRAWGRYCILLGIKPKKQA